jgi:hypothetical protein
MSEIFEKFRKFFKEWGEELSLSKAGIKAISDERYFLRQKALLMIQEKIYSNEFKDAPIERIKLMDNYIAVFTAPYGRAMENRHIAQMLIAWQQLKSWYYDLYSIVNEYPIGSKLISSNFYVNEEKRKTFLEILDRIAIEDVLPLGMIIITTLYSIIDVTPSHVIVAQPVEEVSEAPEEEISPDSELFKTYEGLFAKDKKSKKQKESEE